MELPTCHSVFLPSFICLSKWLLILLLVLSLPMRSKPARAGGSVLCVYSSLLTSQGAPGTWRALDKILWMNGYRVALRSHLCSL